ncbi:3-hydroxyacyl-CoA dehydrogenase, partial [Tatlockia micdadei]
GAIADLDTIFATNTSTLLPSNLMEATGRPERFLALHFANQIWVNNTAEIMRTPRTDDAVFDQVVAFAKDIGMVALPLHKEQPGYILNTLLVP